MLKIYFHDLSAYFKSRRDYSALVHRVCCVLSGLLMADYLLMCIFSFSMALDDMELYEDLGFHFSFGYHLTENYFPEIVQMLLPMAIMFFLYVMLYRRAKNAKLRSVAFWYFVILALLHILMFTHAASLDYSKAPPYTAADDLCRNYFLYARIAMVQSGVYFVSYLLRIRETRAMEKWIAQSKQWF